MKPNIVYIASEILVVGKSSRIAITLRSVLIRLKANKVNRENKYIKTCDVTLWLLRSMITTPRLS